MSHFFLFDFSISSRCNFLFFFFLPSFFQLMNHYWFQFDFFSDAIFCFYEKDQRSSYTQHIWLSTCISRFQHLLRYFNHQKWPRKISHSFHSHPVSSRRQEIKFTYQVQSVIVAQWKTHNKITVDIAEYSTRRKREKERREITTDQQCDERNDFSYK